MRLLCVTVAGNAIGFGHLNRCLSIAAGAAEQASVGLFVFGDGAAGERLKACCHPYRLAPLGAEPVMLPTAALVEAATSSDVIVADLVHSRFFVGSDTTAVFEAMRPQAHVVAAIDALGEECLAVRSPGLPVDMLVVPYVLSDGERARAARVGRRQLLGPAYALLPPDYAGLPERRQRAVADRILVTCGGSDPGAWTPVVLGSLETIADPLVIRVVVGPLFDRALRAQVARLAGASPHSVTVIEAPDSLATHMLWCDLAIAASGLTKYELAATGTPALVFSIDAIQEASNQSFAATGSVIDLGLHPTLASIAGQTLRLLEDHPLRQTMADTGRTLVDGAGTQRLIAELVKELTCSRAN